MKTVLTTNEIERMMAEATCQRDQLIILFLADTGVRVSEMLQVKIENLDLSTKTILIPHLKRGTKKRCPKCGHTAGRSSKFCAKCGENLSLVEAEGIQERHRLITMGKKLARMLGDYIVDMKPEDRLFPITRQRVYNIVRNLAAKAGIKDRMLNPQTGKYHHVHPHTFRASLAVDWLTASGGDLNKSKALQDHLGHVNFDTTMKYHKLSLDDVRKVSDKIQDSRFNDNPT